MEKIKIFSMGGLDEMGKNTYVVEINDDIYVFDCGIKYSEGNMYGIDYVIPNYEYLIKNKDRVKGIFITHGHYENMGGAFSLSKSLPKTPFYASKYTKYLLIDSGLKEDRIIEIEPNKKIMFGKNYILPLSVSHSVPGSLMYAISTSKGYICYTGDFIIDPLMQGCYDMDLGKIAYLGKQGVLCLLTESSFSEHIGHTSPSHRLQSFFEDVISKYDGRIFFSVLPTHLYTINEIFEAAKGTHRKIVIMGSKLQRIIKFSHENHYLDYEEDIIGDLNNINDSNTILLICDDKLNPYASINKILNGYDKFISFKKGDSVVFAEPRYDSNEKTIVKLENDLAMNGCKIVSLPKDKNILHHASREDLMLMIKLLNPKYYMPVKGEYRYLVNNANIASELGMKKENIILKQNGDIVNIEDGKLIDKFEHINIKDNLIDGKSNLDIGELVMKDREMLSDNGIVLISATIDRKTKKLLVGPEITTKGFIYVKESKDLILGMRKISEEVILDNIVDNQVDYNSIKGDIRSKLSEYLYNETETKPMIIAVVQEV